MKLPIRILKKTKKYWLLSRDDDYNRIENQLIFMYIDKLLDE